MTTYLARCLDKNNKSKLMADFENAVEQLSDAAVSIVIARIGVIGFETSDAGNVKKLEQDFAGKFEIRVERSDFRALNPS